MRSVKAICRINGNRLETKLLIQPSIQFDCNSMGCKAPKRSNNVWVCSNSIESARLASLMMGADSINTPIAAFIHVSNDLNFWIARACNWPHTCEFTALITVSPLAVTMQNSCSIILKIRINCSSSTVAEESCNFNKNVFSIFSLANTGSPATQTKAIKEAGLNRRCFTSLKWVNMVPKIIV
ncbi:hypothetical protein FF38_12414 [Lucilia cuprina]|uniref:Uncharacterized protein n=1 Tax=Lucilia cuprina TaxID=7375 RepID=A0A0L0CHD6_LUCCU|nr:hypothetical protein FF38_12414 [Lucilia cuprina]